MESIRRKQTFCRKSDQIKFKIILVGDSGVGKTSLFLSFTEDAQDKTNPSVTTVDFRIQNIQIDGEIIKLHIWDTAGQQKYRSIVQSYFKGCQGSIIAFDLSRKPSFDHAISEWFKICSNHLSPSEIVLIGNKSDLEHAVTEEEIKKWSNQNGVQYFQVSVKNEENIEKPFMALSRKMILKKRQEIKDQLCTQLNPSKPLKSKLKLNGEPINLKKKGCC